MNKEINIRIARYETARVHLIQAVRYLTGSIGYITAPETSNSYQQLKFDFIAKNKLVISREGCSRTIYRNAKINRDARAWHDIIHLKENLNFSYKDEVKVAKIQQRQVISFLQQVGVDDKIAEDAGQLIYIDIAKQAEFYKMNNKFLYNQEAFVIEHFLGYLDTK